MTRTALLARVGLLSTAAAAGGAAALLGAWLLGGFSADTQTIVQQTPPALLQPVGAEQSRNWVNGIYERAAGGVVQVSSTSIVEVAPDPFFGNPFGLPEQQQQRALGSGFVIDEEGHIVTNYHVVENARSIQVSFSNRDTMRARIAGVDPSTDLAVLKVNADSRALTPLALGNSDRVRVGDAVVALGNPLGYDRTATAGIVSALQRRIQAPASYTTIDHVIQTDAAVNRGNSGGPLLDANGQVIGVTSAIATGSATEQGSIGIGFAIPINTVKDVTAQLIRHGHVERPYLGILARPITPELARLFRLPVRQGLVVQRVIPGSAAERSGLRGGTTRVVVAGESYVLGGDVIVKVDGVVVTTVERLRSVLDEKQPGERVALEIIRDGRRQTLTVKLGRQPAPAPPRG